MKEERKREYQENPIPTLPPATPPHPDDELQKVPHTTVRILKPQSRLEPVLNIGGRLGK